VTRLAGIKEIVRVDAENDQVGVPVRRSRDFNFIEGLKEGVLSPFPGGTATPEDVLFDDKLLGRRDHEVVDQLKIVHDPAASHFDADDFFERGLAGIIQRGRHRLTPRGAGALHNGVPGLGRTLMKRQRLANSRYYRER